MVIRTLNVGLICCCTFNGIANIKEGKKRIKTSMLKVPTQELGYAAVSGTLPCSSILACTNVNMTSKERQISAFKV